MGNINEVPKAADTASEVFALHTDIAARFKGVAVDASKSLEVFGRITGLQEQRNAEVAKLSDLCPKTRLALSNIMETAF